MTVQNCNAAQQFPVCIKNGPPPKGHPDNLTQLWEALESTWFWHLVESMTWIEAVLRAKAGVQLNIRKVFLMFGILSVYLLGREYEWTVVCCSFLPHLLHPLHSLTIISLSSQQPERVLQSLKRYMAAEQKDRRHTLRHYQHIEAVDPQKAEQMKFQVWNENIPEYTRMKRYCTFSLSSDAASWKMYAHEITLKGAISCWNNN